MKGNIHEFIMDAFDYPTVLSTMSIDRAVNRYLLEHIANGFVKYGSVQGFIDNIDDWLRSLAGIFKEIGFDHKNHQINATVDLIDQAVVIDQLLYEQLEYVINIQRKYGLMIKFKSAKGTGTTTLLRFFEMIERVYPRIKERFKGLGSSDATVLREVIMDPKTRRIYKVTMDDINRTKEQMGVLIGKSKEEVARRKELLLDFKFTTADIDT